MNLTKNKVSSEQLKKKYSVINKRPSIVLRQSEGKVITVNGADKTLFDFSRKNVQKTNKIKYRENTMDSLGSPLSPNNLQISPKSKRRSTMSGVSTSGSDSEEGTTDITDMTLSVEDTNEKKSKIGMAVSALPFLTSPPPAGDGVVPGVPQLTPVSRWDDTYTDKDRAAAVVMGTKDIKISLLMKRKEEIRRMMPEEKGARVFYGQGVFQHTRHGPGIRATKYFDTALSMQPHSSICYLARSRCYLQSGDAKRALEDANIVLGVDPGSPKALGLIAECYYQLGDFESALLHYHKAAAIRPDYEKYVLGVAKCKRAICNAVGKSVRKKTKKSTPRKTSRIIGEDSLVSTTKSINQDVIYLSNLLKEKAIISQRNNTSEQVLQIAEDALNFLDERKSFWHLEDPACIKSKITKNGSKRKTMIKKLRRKKTTS